MGKFFKFTFASCLGTLLALGVLLLISTLVISRVAMKANEAPLVKANSVLNINFDEMIPERTNNVKVDYTTFETDTKIGLHDMVALIECAKDDDDIKGIFMDLSGISIGGAKASVMRNAILDFKESGKFVVSYSKYYSQGAYYMGSVADKVYVNPMGTVEFRGFAAQIPFFKDMLDRLGIKMQIYYAGQFKSATEPFRLNEMSEQNRLQVREYMDGLYKVFLKDIATSRNIRVGELDHIADGYLIRNAEDAVKFALVDGIKYRDEVYTDLLDRLGLEEEDKINGVAMADYYKGNKPEKDFKAKSKIAVVFAEGTIVDGKGEAGNIGGDKYAKIIRKLRKDDKIKGLVLRVNSGGGSALASDIIWRELELVKEAGIPFVVSMGDVAASGGYYIACDADSIFAEPNTITGSIGVFGMIPSMQQMFKDKVGIQFDTVKTNRFAAPITPFMDIGVEEGKIIQQGVDEIYETFLKRVADGRGMTRNEVHEVAQGRVWIGTKAKEIGLVDAFGGLPEAINAVANMAGLDNYRTTEYPRTKDPIEQMIEDFTGKKQTSIMLQNELGDLYPQYLYLKKFKEMKGVQARLPFLIDVN